MIVRPIHPARALILALLYWLALLPLINPVRHSGNMWSRYMTIESIVERGTLVVSRSPMLPISGTPDLAMFNGRLYSDKPPVLSALGAVVHAPLAWSGLKFMAGPEEFERVNLILVASLVGTASALAVLALRLMSQTLDLNRWLADALALGLGFGSLLFSYGGTFNNHSVGAGLVTAAFALVLLEDPARPRHFWRRWLAGLLAGLAATIDLPAGGAMFLGLLVWLAWRSKWGPVAYLAGALGPLLLHSGLQSLVTGTPLPVELYPEALAFPGSYWASEAGQFQESVPRWRFGLEFLIGPQGWLTITPALIFAPVGLVFAWRRGGPLRAGALVFVGVALLLLVYYTWLVRRTDFAGNSFGVRHLLAITPLAYFFAVLALERLKSRLAWVAFVALLAIGSVYAFEGMREPWRRVEKIEHPPVHLRLLQKGVLYPWSSYER